MKGTIGALDTSGAFHCRACVEKDDDLADGLVKYIDTLTKGSFICNTCDKMIHNEPHLETET